MLSPQYRPDIDGLRALAVIGVLLQHFLPSIFPGGFVGVDIFFVISGYLISGLIFEQLKNSTFTLVSFYVRRINRIFPALIVTLLLSAGLGLFYENSLLQQNLKFHILTSSTFSINFYSFWEIATDRLKIRPLLHLWSLAVEEQFYVFLPILFLSFWKFAEKYFYRSVLTLCALSFAICLLYSEIAPYKAFFFPWARAWEFLIGSLIVLLPKRERSEKNWSTTVLGVGCLLVVILIYVVELPFIKNEANFFTLIPILAAVGLLYDDKNPVNKRVLSNPLLVFFGQISYPLYLIHWPLLYFLKQKQNFSDLSMVTISFGILASVLLAYLVRYKIEDFFLNRKSSIKNAQILLGLMSLFAAASAFFIYR